MLIVTFIQRFYHPVFQILYETDQSIASHKKLQPPSTISFEFLFQCWKCCTANATISEEKWHQLQMKTKCWSGLDIHSNIYEPTA